jgi:hypothetical protein
MFKLVYQQVIADFIECLGEVHNENISLFTIIQVSSHVVDELYKLSFTRCKFAKAMLEGVYYVVFINMWHDVTNYNVF